MEPLSSRTESTFARLPTPDLYGGETGSFQLSDMNNHNLASVSASAESGVFGRVATGTNPPKTFAPKGRGLIPPGEGGGCVEGRCWLSGGALRRSWCGQTSAGPVPYAFLVRLRLFFSKAQI